MPSSISQPRARGPQAVRRSLPALTLALALLGAVSEANAGTPRVVASIAPLHALISDVMSGLGSPALLIPANQSPHGYALRPSDMLALSEADLIVWIGPGLDGAVGRAVRSLKPDAVAIEALRLDGLTLHEATFDHNHGQDEGTMDGEPSEHGVVDPHLWLDPLNAIALVDVFAATLAEIDRDHAAQYEENALALKERLRALDVRLRARLAPVAKQRYVVFHSAYQYLERRYGLEGGVALTIDPEQPPGPRQVEEIRRLVRAGEVACVFAEPQFPRALAEVLVEDSGARIAVLDPLGTGLKPGPGAYVALMENLVESLIGCLAR